MNTSDCNNIKVFIFNALPVHKTPILMSQRLTQQTRNVSVAFLESCSVVALDLTLQIRFYNVLSDLCLDSKTCMVM